MFSSGHSSCFNVELLFLGGREVSGVLNGFDPLLNLVLDKTIEYLRDPGENDNIYFVINMGPNPELFIF